MTNTARRESGQDLRIPGIARGLALMNVSNPMVVLKDGYVAEVNDLWLSVLGYASREEIVGRHVTEFLTPQSWATAQVRLAQRQAGQQVPPKVVYDVVHRSGPILKVEITSVAWPTDSSIVVVTAVEVTQQVRQVEALAESERLYRTLAETLPLGVSLMDASGRRIYVNEQILRLTGYTADELMAVGWILDPTDVEARRRYADALANGTSVTDYETRVVRKDGSTVWVSLSWSPVKDADGSVVGVHTAFTDISDRKRAENALRTSEASLRTFVNALVYPAFLIDAQGTFLMVNEALAKRLGLSVEELTGRHADDVVAEGMTALRRGWAIKVVKSGTPAQFEDETPDGVSRHYLCPVLDEAGAASRLAWVSIDISEQRKAEEKLRETEERFRRLAENATDLIWEIDLDGRFAYVSGAVRLWGYEPDEWIGHSVEEFLPDEEKSTFRRRLARDRRDSSSRRYEVNMHRKDGSIGCCEISIDVVLENGKPVRIQGIARDITERKRAENALRKAHSDLEEAFRIQQEFLNSVTHEIRTPMTAVKGYVEMLLEGIAGPVTNEQAAMMQKVLASSDSLLNLVSSLLEMARLRSGGVGLHPRACKPGDLAAKAVAAVAPQAARKGLAVEICSRGADPVAIYDEQKVTIVLTNLLSNAVKFTPKGKIDVMVSSRAWGAEFVIVDTGIGIRQSELRDIFDEFRQLSVPHKHKPSGFGLGLAIVARMVEILDGTLVVSSRRRVGTAFTLRVPRISA